MPPPLILINECYVNPAHIVQVAAHPADYAVCILLSNGQEIRVKHERSESGAEATARIARLIMSKCT